MKTLIGSIFAAAVAVTFYFVQLKFQPKLLPIVEGFFQPEFMAVANVLSRNMGSGTERGGALAVFYDGEPIIDMWMGYADTDSLTRWRNHTTTLTFDCSKAVLAILVAKMVERELLNYSVPISEYWPEFGNYGKDRITIEQVLSHQAGLPYLSESLSWWDLQDNPRRVEQLLQKQSPVLKPGLPYLSESLSWWDLQDNPRRVEQLLQKQSPVTLGSKFAYHSHTYGLILDKLVQKLDSTHRDVAILFEEEIASKYDIEFSFRVKKSEFHKTARLKPASMTTRLIQMLTSPLYLKNLLTSMLSTSELAKTFGVIKEFTMPYSILNNPELREIPIPSNTGTGTARGLAKLFSLLFIDTIHGRPLLYPSTVKLLTEVMVDGTCPITGLQMSLGRGVQIFKNPWGESVFGHSGEGGQMIIADLHNKLTIAYLTNHLSVYRNGEDTRFSEIQAQVYNKLERYIERRNRQT